MNSFMIHRTREYTHNTHLRRQAFVTGAASKLAVPAGHQLGWLLEIRRRRRRRDVP